MRNEYSFVQNPRRKGPTWILYTRREDNIKLRVTVWNEPKDGEVRGTLCTIRTQKLLKNFTPNN